MAKAAARARLTWEQLPESSQRIYLALAEGEEQRARQLHDQDQQPRARRRRRRAGRAVPAAKAKPPPKPPATRNLRGFVALGGRMVPREMADAEAWKRRQARR